MLVEQLHRAGAAYLEFEGDEIVAEYLRPAPVEPEGAARLPDDALSLAQLAAVIERPSLPRLVEDVYRAFADVKHPPAIAGCPCCVDPDADCTLVTVPLRALTFDDLERYLWKAVTTWGSAADFCYFVPRILEIVVLEQPAELELAVVLGKFRRAGWTQWPARRHSGVDRLLTGYWSAYLSDYPGPQPVADVLAGLSILVSPAALLARWTPLRTANSALHLRDLLATGFGADRQLRDEPARSDALAAWQQSPQLRSAVDEAFFQTANPVAADALSVIADYLRTDRPPS